MNLDVSYGVTGGETLWTFLQIFSLEVARVSSPKLTPFIARKLWFSS